jgi:hypothetical protein
MALMDAKQRKENHMEENEPEDLEGNEYFPSP